MRCILVCSAALAGMAFAQSTAHATFPGANGQIIWHSEGNEPFRLGNSPLDAETAAGEYPVGVNPSRENVFVSRIDPTGTRLAYLLERGKGDLPGCDPDEPGECKGEHEIYISDLDGTDVEQVTDSAAFEQQPVWGSDGSELAYIADGQLVVEDLESGDKRTIGEYASSFDWSPNGELFAVRRTAEVWIIDAETEEEHLLATVSTGGVFAPDSSKLLLARSVFDPGRGDFVRNGYITPVDSPTNAGLQLVYDAADPANDGYDFGGGVWSPDGSEIIVSTTKEVAFPDDTLVHLMPGGGGALTPLPVNAVPEISGPLDWQSLPVLDEVEVDAEADQRISTGEAPGPSEPAEAAVTTPNAGPVSIQRIAPATDTAAGYRVLGAEFRISAPAADAAEPLILEFLIDSSLIPSGTEPEDIEVLRNGEPAADCTSPMGAVPDPCVATREPLSGGDARVRVRTSSASAWNLAVRDDVAPEVAITQGPSLKTRKRKVKFEFAADEEATFECKLDSAKWTACESSYKTRKLPYGKHQFQVRATDLAKNVGAPAKRPFRVVR